MAKKTQRKRGRRPKYKVEYCDKLIKFFDIEPYEDIELPHYNQDGSIKWTDFKRMPARLPTLRRFAKGIKVGISTIYDWLDEKHSSYHKEFSDAFTHAKEIRKDFLIENGLQGLYAPLSFKFVAINMTDMTDKQEFEHSGEIRLLPPKIA